MQDIFNSQIKKNHLSQLIRYSFTDELKHFEETYDEDISTVDYADKEEVESLINHFDIHPEWNTHIFSTYLKLYYLTF